MSISFGSTLPLAAVPTRSTTAQKAQKLAISGIKASADTARTLGICLTGADIGPGFGYLKELSEFGANLLKFAFKKVAG